MKRLVETPAAWLRDYAANSMIILVVLCVIVAFFFFMQQFFGGSQVFGWILALAPIWLPIATFLLFFEHWLDYVRYYAELAAGRTTLEIKLPPEVMKSPEAMELIIMQLYQPAAPDNHVQTYWDGKVPPVFSLEMVSRHGRVTLYINTQKKFKNYIESQIYSQYPGVEVVEMPLDYTAEIPWDPERFGYFAFHFGLRRPDPYPIKTYFDYGLHMMPKEEEKVDPLTSTLEKLGSLGQGEHMWIQILIKANRKENFKTGSLGEKPDWRGAVEKEIEGIMEAAAKRAGEERVSAQHLNDGEKDLIKALQRSLGKYAFNTNIRTLYIAKNEVFDGKRISGMASIFRQYDDVNRNSFAPRWRTDTDWPWWQDRGGKNTTRWKKRELREYKTRTFERKPHESKTTYIFTTEELATLFHIPGRVALTPTLERIPSTRAEAPANLPTG